MFCGTKCPLNVVHMTLLNGDLIIFTLNTLMKYTSGNNLSGFVCLMTQQHTLYLRCQKTHSSIPQIIPSWSKKKLNRIFWEPQLPNAFSFGLGVPCQSATSAAQREAFKELFLQSTFLSVKEKEKREILFLNVSLLFAGVALLYFIQLKKKLLRIALLWQIKSEKSNMLRFVL